jgi:hypothetical protein
MLRRPAACLLLLTLVAGCKKTSGAAGVKSDDDESETQTDNQTEAGPATTESLDDRISSYQFEAMGCAVSAFMAGAPAAKTLPKRAVCMAKKGLPIAFVLKRMRECALNGTKEEAGMLTCMQAGGGDAEKGAAAIAECFAANVADAQVFARLGVAGSVVGCTLTVAKGVLLLDEAIKGAGAARDYARQSADQLRNAIGKMTVSRLYNWGYLRGCIQVLSNGNEAACKSYCETPPNGTDGGFLSNEQARTLAVICASGCVASESRPASWVATVFGASPRTTREGCQLIKDRARDTIEGKKATRFRVIPFPGTEQGEGIERYRLGLAWKVRLNTSIAILRQNYNAIPKVPGTNYATIDGLKELLKSQDPALQFAASTFTDPTLGTITLMAANPQATPNGRLDQQTYYGLMETSSGYEADGVFSDGDLADFAEEVQTYNWPCPDGVAQTECDAATNGS